MVTIVDYDTGNIRSVQNAFKRLGAEFRMSSDPAEILRAERLFLPGVGEMSTAMAKLRERGLVEAIKSVKVPVLGICLGMQVMCRYGEEGGGVEGMGIFDNTVSRLCGDKDHKVPHVGWNSITRLKSRLFDGVDERAFVYYVHSFGADVNENTIAATVHGSAFSGALACGNFYGCQFHPEKSGQVGEQILSNFLKL